MRNSGQLYTRQFKALERLKRYHRWRRLLTAAALANGVIGMIWLLGLGGRITAAIHRWHDGWNDWHSEYWADAPLMYFVNLDWSSLSLDGVHPISQSIANIFLTGLFTSILIITAVFAALGSSDGKRQRQNRMPLLIALALGFPTGFLCITAIIDVLTLVVPQLPYSLVRDVPEIWEINWLYAWCVIIFICTVVWRFVPLARPYPVALIRLIESVVSISTIATIGVTITIACMAIYDNELYAILYFVACTPLSWGLIALTNLAWLQPQIVRALDREFCLACAYDLRGSIAAGQITCPECGSPIVYEQPNASEEIR